MIEDERRKAWAMGWLVIYSTGAARTKPALAYTHMERTCIMICDQALARAAMTSYMSNRNGDCK